MPEQTAPQVEQPIEELNPIANPVEEVQVVETEKTEEAPDAKKLEELYAASTKEALELKKENEELKQYAALGAVAKEWASKDPKVAKKLEKVIANIKAGKDATEALEDLDDAVEEAKEKETQNTEKVEKPQIELPPELQEVVDEKRSQKEALLKEADNAWTKLEATDQEFAKSSVTIKRMVPEYAKEIYQKGGLTVEQAFVKAVSILVHGGLQTEQAAVEKQELEKSIATGSFIGNTSSTAGTADTRLEKAAKNMSAASNGKVSVERARKILEVDTAMIEEYLE